MYCSRRVRQRVSGTTRTPHDSVAAVAGPAPNAHHDVPGYSGLYNLRHYFYVEAGSRVYGPKPHITLNIYQDLQFDFGQRLSRRPDYHLLLASLDKPLTPAALRVYSALRWFNAANEDGIDPDRALLNLAVAFEALLRLPDSSKTDRLVNAIALLLGRTERLDDWAKQFYEARSRVAHEGQVDDLYFYISTSGKPKQLSGLFGSLMLYGRQVFQLCLGTLLVGIDLADRADLEEKFVTNNERYQKICDLLKDIAGAPTERILSLEITLRALEKYQFIPSGDVAAGTMITAVRHAAATMIECGQPLTKNLIDALEKSATSKREDGELAQLAIIEQLDKAFRNTEPTSLSPEARIVRDLVTALLAGLISSLLLA